MKTLGIILFCLAGGIVGLLTIILILQVLLSLLSAE
jgi:hypothetical protein